MALEFGCMQAFIWDFDGTLFDTYPVIIGDLRLALGDFGCDADPVEVMGYMLMDFGTAFHHYADLYRIDPAALRQRYDFYHTRSNGALAAQPMPGAAQVLRKICALGGHNYIFTHRHVDEARKYLAKYGLSDYFREVVGPESPCFARKPAPDAILYLLRRYGIAPEAAVMIGDRDCDLGSARAAGIRTAHLLCPQVPQTLNADWHFADLGRLLCAL